jgi:hypothetical protein
VRPLESTDLAGAGHEGGGNGVSCRWKLNSTGVGRCVFPAVTRRHGRDGREERKALDDGATKRSESTRSMRRTAVSLAAAGFG